MPEDLQSLLNYRRALPVVLLVAFWLWETWWPFFERPVHRLKHALHNLLLAVANTLILPLAFGTATVLVCDWADANQYGLLHALPIGEAWQMAIALLLLDAWMYVWHRANHVVPLLWRFHRMHHSDDQMDVTTATRFHIGEHVGSNVLRLGLVPLFGLSIWQIVVYEMLVVANTQLHHANISLGRWDRWLRLLIVTPDMHKMHHSRERRETDSNYSTILSLWDRLARSLTMRDDLRTLHFGLDEYDSPNWQTVWGMLKTPFVSAKK